MAVGEIPSLLLKQLYTFSSLENVTGGVMFTLKNRLSDAMLIGIRRVAINGHVIPLDQVMLRTGEDTYLSPVQITPDSPLDFPLRRIIHLICAIDPLAVGKHTIDLEFEVDPFGTLNLRVDDTITLEHAHIVRIPRDDHDDYAESSIGVRRAFVEQMTGAHLEHTSQYSIDPHVTQGNIENFTGVAQIPLGFAGPIRVNGEHAHGEFLIPMATTEGTLVASYNRGIKVLNLCGGAMCTVVADVMQRAPVFVFENARAGREFAKWVDANKDKLAHEAESTSRVAKLQYIDTYLASKFVYLRFNFWTGDAAGQNMVGRATFAACSWILDNYTDYPIKHFYLESNFATDKKASHVNVMRTRGKRVTAECVLLRDVLLQHMRVEPERLDYHLKVANVGAFLSGANNNGAHSPNAITAMFIATGQDVANVAESSAGVLYTEVTPEGDLYISLTIPSLIVATHGGGTGLPTQRECLRVLGCHERGSAHKLAEIVAAVALAGEISLGSAISSSDWVSSHEKYGRNR